MQKLIWYYEMPTQGIVLAGRSVVDESMLSGESLPVFKEEGLRVSSGTINWVRHRSLILTSII